MITAEEARKLSNHYTTDNQDIGNMLHVISEKIKETCHDGLSKLDMNFYDVKYFKYRDKVADILRINGFTVRTSIETWRNEEYCSFHISW